MDSSRRIYPLDPKELTEEQLAVVFAMTSRNPRPFDEIAQLVTEEKAADFHERWVLNYGHSSVAEHAVIHMAVENISRLACDMLEDNRLASYTEKSSRYQLIDHGFYHIPVELKNRPLLSSYTECCDFLFDSYKQSLEKAMTYLKDTNPIQEGERQSSYDLRLRRIAIDVCRFILPSATLTNVGVTMNARSWEHAIQKLLSSNLSEENEIGQILKDQGQSITPTLIKYADRNNYLVLSKNAGTHDPSDKTYIGSADCSAQLVHYDPDAETKLIASLLYEKSNKPYNDLFDFSKALSDSDKEAIVDKALKDLGPHDVPVRQLENIDYTFDLIMDYGAYREFKRHRMQTYIPQPLTVDLGYVVPDLIRESGQEENFISAMDASYKTFHEIAPDLPRVAEYVVTHAHLRRVVTKINLRECYHLFKLRTSPQAHFTLRQVMNSALNIASELHPLLFRYIRIRN